MPAELRDAFRQDAAALDDLRALARGVATDAATPRLRTVTPAQVAALTRELITAFTGTGFGFRLLIAGQHYSGLSNQALLEVRAGEGRDYGADTVQLKQWLRRELLSRFRGLGRVPTTREVADLASLLVVNFVATRRVLGGGGDIEVPPLTPRYAAAKARAGFGGKPIGVRSGRWLQSLLRQGRVVFTHVSGSR